MVTVMLYGFLGRRFGKVHRYDVRSPAEAVRALSVTLPEFRRALADGGAYRVLVGGKDALPLERIGNPVSERESIRIVPVIAGSRGLGQIILGAALIFAAPYLAGSYGIFVDAIAAGKIATSIGVSLVLGGAAQMLFAPPKQQPAPERPENKPSYAFDGAVNAAAQGNPVPVLYGGPLIVGSQVISAGLTVEQIA